MHVEGLKVTQGNLMVYLESDYIVAYCLLVNPLGALFWLRILSHRLDPACPVFISNYTMASRGQEIDCTEIPTQWVESGPIKFSVGRMSLILRLTKGGVPSSLAESAIQSSNSSP